MAIDYTEHFTLLGRCIKHINLIQTDETNSIADEQNVADVFEADDQSDLISPQLSNAINTQRNAFRLARVQLAALGIKRFLQDDTVYDELGLPSKSQDAVLAAFAKQMVADSESIDASVVTLGSVTANAGNTGNTTILLDKGLDGITAPGRGLKALIENRDFDSELCKSEDCLVTCVSDQYRDGAISGKERYQISGEQSFPAWSYDEGGSGRATQLRTVLDLSHITNGTFENITSNVPDNWTLAAGTAGTHILEETVQIYRDTKSVEFAGNASLAAITITIAPNSLTQLAGKRVVMGMWYKASATQAGTVELRLNVSGTGFSPSSGQKIVITGDNFQTDWTLSTVVFNLPLDLPSDSVLTLSLAGTPEAAKTVWVNQVFLCPVQFHGGFNVSVIPGDTDPIAGDRWTFAVSNDGAGTFQSFFRRSGYQLPSDTGGSETISDSLAS